MKTRSSVAILATMIFVGADAGRAADDGGWSAEGKRGAVAAGAAKSVDVGLAALEQGGNAADAAASTLLALAITDYGSFSIGGEVSLLIYDSQRREVKSLCGQGAAPRDPAAIRWYYENGIPHQGSMKAAPVPGAIDLCVTLLRHYGTISFTEAVTPAIELLDRGDKDWHPRLAVTLRKLVDAEKKRGGSRDENLLAVSDRFYRGDVADELEAWYIATGATLRKADLAAHQTLIEDPVSTAYRGYSVYKCGPWTQGPYLCQTLEILEGFDLRAMRHLSADYVHVVTEALKLGLADRDEYYGDPRFVAVPMTALLSESYATERRALIDPNKASLERRPGDPRRMRAMLAAQPAEDAVAKIPVQDTTTCVVADRWGNVVAATPSCNMLTNTPGPNGVNQGNRIRCLNTNRQHPNRLEPGKRPRITLTPTLVLRDGKPVMAISVAGGDLQDQTTLNVLLNRIEFGMTPDKAVTAPRFSTSHHQNTFDPNPDRKATIVGLGQLQLQESIATETREELAKRGHVIKTTAGAIANPVMLAIDSETGLIQAAGDPRAGRHAGALK